MRYRYNASPAGFERDACIHDSLTQFIHFIHCLVIRNLIFSLSFIYLFFFYVQISSFFFFCIIHCALDVRVRSIWVTAWILIGLCDEERIEGMIEFLRHEILA